MTEKNYNPKQKQKKAMKKSEVAMKKVPEKIAKKEEKIAEKVAKKVPEKKKEKTPETKVAMKKAPEKIAKGASETKEKKQEPKKTKPKTKKEEAIVNSYNIPISTKKAAAICRFIKGKTIEFSQDYLENVIRGKKAIPMKGEIPHRKGKMMSGGFPKNAAKQFIILLKSLMGNSNVNGIEDPIIVEAIANIAPRPYSRFGRWRRKRTHVKLIAKERKKSKPKPLAKKEKK